MDILHGLHTIVRLLYETLASLYYILLLVGAIGIAFQGVFGFMHGSGGAHNHAHAGSGGAHGGHNGGGHAGEVPLGNHHTPIAHHTPAAPGATGAANHAAPSAPAAAATHNGGHTTAPHSAGGGAKPASAQKEISPLWSWLSPMTVFSVCLGTGASGLLLVAHLGKPLTALVALLCGVAFYALITKPLMRIVLGFASKPATNLAGTVAQNAVAMSRFDAQGRGMVTVTIDGELKRLLAHLDKQDIEKAVAVVPGDQLVVVSVDPQKNTCAVMKV